MDVNMPRRADELAIVFASPARFSNVVRSSWLAPERLYNEGNAAWWS
jgi:hypothetical protein